MNLLPAGGHTDDSITAATSRSMPSRPAIRSRHFHLLTNEEDVWRLLGTSTLRWTLVRPARRVTSSSSVSVGWTTSSRTTTWFHRPSCSTSRRTASRDGGGEQVVQPESERRAQPRLTRSIRRRSDQGTQWTTSAGIQYEERQLNVTQVTGRTLLPGQESPQQTDQPDRVLAYRTRAGPGSLRPGRGVAVRPAPLADGRGPG